MSHVFIGYSRKDAEFVTDLAKRLEGERHPPFVDTSSIRGGSDWRRAIEDGISSAYALLVAVSSDAVKSPWVKKEIEFALRSVTLC